jgi:hypothetical protein
MDQYELTWNIETICNDLVYQKLESLNPFDHFINTDLGNIWARQINSRREVILDNFEGFKENDPKYSLFSKLAHKEIMKVFFQTRSLPNYARDLLKYSII